MRYPPYLRYCAVALSLLALLGSVVSCDSGGGGSSSPEPRAEISVAVSPADVFQEGTPTVLCSVTNKSNAPGNYEIRAEVRKDPNTRQVLYAVLTGELGPGQTGKPVPFPAALPQSWGPGRYVAEGSVWSRRGALLDSESVEFTISRKTFVRGDLNLDQSVNLSDAVVICLAILYGTVGDLPCLRAADANDDGAVTFMDAGHILVALFGGGPPIEPPNPDCGSDATQDNLSCVQHDGCAP